VRKTAGFRGALSAGLLLGVVLGALIAAGVLKAVSPAGSPSVEQRPPALRGELGADERATIALFHKAAASVVYITTRAQQYDFWTRNVFEVPQGTGSGFVWDELGHIVTNFHVVQGADAAEATLGEDSFEATLVGTAPDQDVAVLKIKAPRARLVPIKIGTSADIEVGQKVLAIGNPFGLDHTLTTGIVSALGRTIQSVTNRPIDGAIQTDAAINPGNSGGPLLDSTGRLIGMNTAIYSPSGASAGIGFAVPVDTVNRIVSELIVHGKVIRPRLGISLDDRLSAVVTRRLGVKGVLLRDVDRGTPADRAGLRGTKRSGNGIIPGDILQEIDGKPIASSDEFLGRIGNFRPGDTVTLTVYRDGQVRRIKATLEAAE
jgi:S1-C subfamily serine protease